MKTFTIKATGRTLSDIEDAIREALRFIQSGNLSGFGENEDGSFHFDSSGEFEDDEEADDTETFEANHESRYNHDSSNPGIHAYARYLAQKSGLDT